MSTDFCVAFESNFPYQNNEYVDEYNCIDLHDTSCTTDCKCCICNITTDDAPIYTAPQYSESIAVEEPINIEVNEVNNELIDDDAISIEWCNYDCECELCSFIASDAYTSLNVIPAHCVVSNSETETCIIWVTQHGTECNCFGVEMEVDTEIETELETESVEVTEDSNE